MKRAKLYAEIVRVLPAIVVEEYGQPHTCIPASYHAAEVLRARGIPARLQVFDLIAGNAEWWAFMATKPANLAAMPPGAWSVGATNFNPDQFTPGLNGHLCVISKGAILDCALGQFSRPLRAMPLPDGVYLPRSARGEWYGEGVAAHYRPSALAVPPMWKLDPEAGERVRARIGAALGAAGGAK